MLFLFLGGMEGGKSEFVIVWEMERGREEWIEGENKEGMNEEKGREKRKVQLNDEWIER